VHRKDLFITTKLWIQRNGYEGTRRAFERSLKRLQLDYIDLFLIHQPFGDVNGEWRAIEELYAQGRAKDTATSSFFDHRAPEMVKWLGEQQGHEGRQRAGP
jgi:2,5-diketo-D-gluconate reductase A